MEGLKGLLRVLNAPGCSVSCCNTIPSSRERRSKSRPSHPVPALVGDKFSERNGFEKPNFEGSLPSIISAGSDSPKMTESKSSSIPMKSRMTLRVMRCQKVSLSSIAGDPALKDSVVVLSSAFLATESLTICSESAVPDVLFAR